MKIIRDILEKMTDLMENALYVYRTYRLNARRGLIEYCLITGFLLVGDFQISYTHWYHKGAVFQSAGGKRCLWESSPGPQVCQERYGICMPSSAGCSWMPSVAYNKCIVQHQRQRVQQRPRDP